MVFSREIGRPKGAKSKHIFEIRCWCVVSCAPLAVVFHRVHWVAGGRLLWLVLLSCRVPRLLPSFLLCLWCITLEYGSVSRFKGVLEGLGALRGLWGFCARVELGGYMTCGVFAPIFSFFSSSPHIFCGFAFVVLGLFSWLLGFCSWFCLFSLCGLLLFLFPFRMYTQKERVQFLASSLVLLWAFYGFIICLVHS